MAEYRNPSPIARAEAEMVFESGTKADICDALVAVAFYDKDWQWSQMQCLRFLENADPDVSGLAATCLGHIARIHRKLDREIVIAALRKKLSDQKIGGCVRDALDDIQMFA